MCMCTVCIRNLPKGPYRKGKSNPSAIGCRESDFWAL